MKTSEKTQRILTSPAAQRIVNSVSPIYSQAEAALWLFEAIGRQLDEMGQWADSYQLQVTPQTATWALGYYELAYGLPVHMDWPLERRREAVLVAMRTRAPMNPRKVEGLLATLTGVRVVIEESTGKNRFLVRFLDWTAKAGQAGVRQVLDRAKPAHLIYDLRAEIPAAPVRNIGWAKSQLTVQVLADNLGMRQVYLDGGYLLDGSWLLGGVTSLGVKFRGLEVAVKSRTANYISSAYVQDNTWRWDGSVLLDGSRLMNAGPFTYSLSPVQVGVKAQETGRVWAGLGVRAAGRNRAWAGMEGLGLAVQGRSGEHTGAAITLDTMWRLDGSRVLDGGRKLNAGIVTVEL